MIIPGADDTDSPSLKDAMQISSQGISRSNIIFHTICKKVFVVLYIVLLITEYPWLSASSMGLVFNSQLWKHKPNQLETVLMASQPAIIISYT